MPSPRPDPERGAIAVLAALVLAVVGSFLALGFEVGHMMQTRTAAHLAVDAGALAGVLSIDGTAAGLDSARAAATRFTTLHYLDGEQVSITPSSDIASGIWDFARSTFTTSLDPTVVNAIRVTAGRDASGLHNGPLPLYFGGLLGAGGSVAVHASAIAAGGGVGSGCALPMVMAACTARSGAGGALQCDQHLVFGDANIDNIGWTNLDPGSRAVSTREIVDNLNGNSAQPDYTTNPATGLPCRNIQVNDQLPVGNGNNLNNQVEDAFYHPTHGPAGGYVCAGATCPKVVVSVVDVPCAGGNPSFTGVNPVVGFATFTINSVSAHPRAMDISMQCQQTSPRPGGGTFFGTSGRPRLVQ